jgi:hypothetical protein
MKKAMFALLLTVSAVPAFAQRFPSGCQVAAVDSYNRVIARFYGRMDYRTGMCREGLRNCHLESRRRGWYDVRCVQLRY